MARALLTDRERAILSGEANVEDEYRRVVEHRARKRIKQLADTDLPVIFGDDGLAATWGDEVPVGKHQ